MKKKILAYNLPAFHQIPENDKWWGEGFTEWDNVKRAKPLYKGHIQPLTPLNYFYYDLSKKEDVVKQAYLAKEYGIYGFVYYHYWFNGKMLLEKPAELFRDSKEVDFNYCFCWANESWCRTWDGNEKKEILMPQVFGGVEDWESHFQYFLSFFQDSRYIKIDNAPMLFVYSISRIPLFDEMFSYWNRRAIESGFSGIYLVETISPWSPKVSSEYSKAVTEFEPMYTIRYEISLKNKIYRWLCKKMKRTEYLDYDHVWKSILSRKRQYKGRVIFQGVFSQWDNSPRKGKNSIIIKGATSQKFKKYLEKLFYNERKDVSHEFFIINAWNEWGEGAILEPSEQYGFEYAEKIKELLERDSLIEE